ncbi:MAG: diguanylate cyclase, partial [Lachnospiraceae bacterium]|nr:diguanylate cyclase [Lachnospiraceae bacterium]
GDIKSPEDIREKENKYPELRAVMIGRGLITDPALAREYKGGEPLDPEEFRLFFRIIFKIYRSELNADKYALDKMKELWGWA